MDYSVENDKRRLMVTQILNSIMLEFETTSATNIISMIKFVLLNYTRNL